MQGFAGPAALPVGRRVVGGEGRRGKGRGGEGRGGEEGMRCVGIDNHFGLRSCIPTHSGVQFWLQ